MNSTLKMEAVWPLKHWFPTTNLHCGVGGVTETEIGLCKGLWKEGQAKSNLHMAFCLGVRNWILVQRVLSSIMVKSGCRFFFAKIETEI
jgi:hypothetical protein